MNGSMNISAQDVVHKLRTVYLPDLQALRLECIWLKTNLGLEAKRDLHSNETKLIQFVQMIDQVIAQIESLMGRDVSQDGPENYMMLESSIVRTILPVRARLHEKWRENQGAAAGASSGAGAGAGAATPRQSASGLTKRLGGVNVAMNSTAGTVGPPAFAAMAAPGTASTGPGGKGSSSAGSKGTSKPRGGAARSKANSSNSSTTAARKGNGPATTAAANIGTIDGTVPSGYLSWGGAGMMPTGPGTPAGTAGGVHMTQQQQQQQQQRQQQFFQQQQLQQQQPQQQQQQYNTGNFFSGGQDVFGAGNIPRNVSTDSSNSSGAGPWSKLTGSMLTMQLGTGAAAAAIALNSRQGNQMNNNSGGGGSGFSSTASTPRSSSGPVGSLSHQSQQQQQQQQALYTKLKPGSSDRRQANQFPMQSQMAGGGAAPYGVGNIDGGVGVNPFGQQGGANNFVFGNRAVANSSNNNNNTSSGGKASRKGGNSGVGRSTGNNSTSGASSSKATKETKGRGGSDNKKQQQQQQQQQQSNSNQANVNTKSKKNARGAAGNYSKGGGAGAGEFPDKSRGHRVGTFGPGIFDDGPLEAAGFYDSNMMLYGDDLGHQQQQQQQQQGGVTDPGAMQHTTAAAAGRGAAGNTMATLQSLGANPGKRSYNSTLSNGKDMFGVDNHGGNNNNNNSSSGNSVTSNRKGKSADGQEKAAAVYYRSAVDIELNPQISSSLGLSLVEGSVHVKEDEYMSSRRRRRLNQIVPNPRKPRTADYNCYLCNEPYTMTVVENPWWAVYHHECPKCKQKQIPRIDISTTRNAIELDPNVVALYGEGVEDSEEEEGGGFGFSDDDEDEEAEEGAEEGQAMAAVTGSENPAAVELLQYDDGSAKVSSTGSAALLNRSESRASHGEYIASASAAATTTAGGAIDSTGRIKSEPGEATKDGGDEAAALQPPQPPVSVKVPFDGDGLLAREEASKLLVLMCHARTCNGVHASERHAEICKSTKFLMLHIRDCKGTDIHGRDCMFPWCRPCKKMLRHLTQCFEPETCTVCNPWCLPKSFQQLQRLNKLNFCPPAAGGDSSTAPTEPTPDMGVTSQPNYNINNNNSSSSSSNGSNASMDGGGTSNDIGITAAATAGMNIISAGNSNIGGGACIPGVLSADAIAAVTDLDSSAESSMKIEPSVAVTASSDSSMKFATAAFAAPNPTDYNSFAGATTTTSATATASTTVSMEPVDNAASVSASTAQEDWGVGMDFADLSSSSGGVGDEQPQKQLLQLQQEPQHFSAASIVTAASSTDSSKNVSNSTYFPTNIKDEEQQQHHQQQQVSLPASAAPAADVVNVEGTSGDKCLGYYRYTSTD